MKIERSKGNEDRFPFTEDGMVTEAAGFEKILDTVKIIGNVFRFVTVRADGDALTAKFPVSHQDIRLGVRLTKSVLIAGCVDFQTESVVNDGLENFIQDFAVTFITVVLIFIWAVSDDVVDMTVSRKNKVFLRYLFSKTPDHRDLGR